MTLKDIVGSDAVVVVDVSASVIVDVVFNAESLVDVVVDVVNWRKLPLLIREVCLLDAVTLMQVDGIARVTVE